MPPWSKLAAAALVLPACATRPGPVGTERPAHQPPAELSAPVASVTIVPDGAAATETSDAADAGIAADAGSEIASGSVSLADAATALFPGRSARLDALSDCAVGTAKQRVSCLLGRAYGADERALKTAVDLHTRSGTIVGVEREYDMDGGYRGVLHLVPELAVGKHRRHLEYIDGAARDQQAFRAALSGLAKGEVKYRVEPLIYRVFRSVGRTTPAAYAQGWSIAYNVSGSLNTSADAVRETLFHEVFHLNDADHGDWSPGVLGADYARIVERCGTKMGCLRPYAPNDTTVRGGTYYAFQPGNDVREYAAELAVRYYREHRALLGVGPGRPPASPFKCGPPENVAAWGALRDEFFGGVDRTPACPPR